MKKIYILFLLTFLVVSSRSQQPLNSISHPSLTPDEQLVLSSIPLLEVPEKYRGPDAPLLPYSIDNSTQPYFRPITSQAGLECGQNAGIGFNFTYEIDRLRNLAANVPANQYPSHFAWNFLNGGSGVGVSCFDSWEIVRACGTMNVEDYGGMTYGGSKRWINGYNYYYNGMGNRLNYMRAIDCSTPEGLQTLKYWLYDHLESASVGGVGNFYGNYFSATLTLPSGTPEAGKYCIANWGSSPSHTWTVCGYNDSIRYDYNGDGQYTNNLDINNDGVVNMHDWEIGGLKFANGYAGTGWGNQGFCYMMYKSLADDIGYGGIWNHRIYVIDVRQTTGTKLAMKITLKHTSRNKLKVMTGVSTNTSATTPDYTQEYPIFRFQGGDYYMQGGTTETDKTIEFGLDLSPLLDQITSGQPARFFLMVQEADPSSAAAGEIVNWSLVDYSSGSPVNIPYGSTNVSLVNNATTTLWLNHTITFSKPVVTTTTLPAANLYQPYSFQLAANSGLAPYFWDLKLDYPETVSPSSFPMITSQQLTVTNANSGYAVKDLPFTIPFYKKFVNKLYIYVDGYILFDNQPYTWPYIIDKTLLFRQTNIISPFMTDQMLYTANSDGIWYQEDANSVTIRWKSSIYNQQSSSGLNYAVKIYRDGKIEYYYGNMNFPAGTSWTGGLSGGDNKNYQTSSLSGQASITTNTLDQFAACGYPVEMSLSDDGLLTGTPENVYTNRPINFRVADVNTISGTKILTFSTNGLLVSYSISSGGDSIIEYGETTLMTVKLTNIGNQTVHNVNIWLTEADSYISMLDSTSFGGDILPGQELVITNAFAFTVSPLVPDNHSFSVTVHVSSTEHNFTKQFDLTAFAPEIVAGIITPDDGDNSRLDPGETTPVKIIYSNTGGAKANNLSVTINSGDQLLTINNATASLGLLKPDSSCTAVFNVTSASSAPFEHLYRMNSSITAANGYARNDSIYLFSGQVVEDFETGDLLKFPWYPGGFGYWYADSLVYYQGGFCTRSGWIYDNQESSLNLSVNVLSDGPITFMKKVSCENDPSGTNYDYLGFYIDNQEMGRWDGYIEWSKETFNVTKGYHTFKWVYHKDYSVSTGSDCSWIDLITFPVFNGAWPVIGVSPASIVKTIDVGSSANDIITVYNHGGGVMDFSALVFDTADNKKNMAPLNLTGSYIESYAEGFVPGQAVAWTFVVHNLSPDNEYIKEIKLDMPEGVTISNATNFSGGSLGELVFSGTTGNGTSLLWHGESSGGKGVIKPGETASTMLTGSVSEALTTDVFVVYSIRGDNSGSAPHSPGNHVKLKNFSLPNGWLTLTNNFGTIVHGANAQVNIHFNAAGLAAPADYSCNIVTKDLYNNQRIIPVLMHVNDTTIIIGTGNNDGNFSVLAYPNPFNGMLNIKYTLKTRSHVVLNVMDATGRKVRCISDKVQDAGISRLVWDGKSDNGTRALPGIYFLTISRDGINSSQKIILTE